MQSLNSTAARAVEIALRIEESRLRASQSVLPSGYLRQTGGEPLSSQELSDLAAQFNLARTSGNNTAALNEFLEYVPTTATPDKMLMIESADYSARDLGRQLGVPSYLLSVSIGAYSYQSSQQSRIDLWTYACKALADCIAETLSSDNVLPRGTFVCFDTDDFLAEAYMGGDMPDDRMNETDIPQDALIEN
jgi:phage portal protein BeeE